MPLAVTHVILTIVALDLFRDFVLKNKRVMPLWMIYLGGFAGIAPDLDIPVFWLVKYLFGASVESFHRTLTHSLVPGLFFLTLAFFLHFKWKRAAMVSGIIAFGVTMHAFLDFLFVGQIMPFYPYSFYAGGFELISQFNLEALIEGIDAAVLLLWLFWTEYKHRIVDFI